MKRPAAALLIGSMCAASSVLAEPTLGTRGEQLDYTQSYAKCKVRDNRKSAQRLVLSNVPDDRVAHNFRDIYVSEPMAVVLDCRELVLRDGVGFRLNPDMFRAAVAEQLVLTEMKEPIASLADRAPLEHWMPESEAALARRIAGASSNRAKTIQSEHESQKATVWLAIYGECVVRKDSLNARKGIVAKPESQAEASAIAGLKPSLGECLATGQTLNFTKDLLRGTIAVNYYRLAKAPIAAAKGTGA